MGYKINKPEEAELVEITLTERDFPIFFEQKVEELMTNCNMLREEARREAEGMKFEIELCYQKSSGLFAIETEAIDSCGSSLFNPYTGEHLEDYDED